MIKIVDVETDLDITKKAIQIRNNYLEDQLIKNKKL
jgi:hypothetical protein